MVQVRVISNTKRNTVIVDGGTTVRQILDDNGINYSVGITSVDGAPLQAGEMDKTLDDFGIKDKCFISVVVKADNA